MCSSRWISFLYGDVWFWFLRNGNVGYKVSNCLLISCEQVTGNTKHISFSYNEATSLAA